MWTAVLEDVHTTAIEAVFGSGVELLIAHPIAVIRKMPLGIRGHTLLLTSIS